MSRMADIQQSSVWYDFADPAALYYTDKLEYHNWNHACKVAENADVIAEQCFGRGLFLDRNVVMVAAAWHDAAYYEDHKAAGHDTKEQYSAALAAAYLRQEGATDEFIGEVEEAILGTTHRAVRKSLAALVLHWADIAEVGAEYKTFATNNYRLLQEARRQQPALKFTEWQAATNNFLGVVITESMAELPKLGEDTSGYNRFPQVVGRNRDKFMKESDEKAFSEAYSGAA